MKCCLYIVTILLLFHSNILGQETDSSFKKKFYIEPSFGFSDINILTQTISIDSSNVVSTIEHTSRSTVMGAGLNFLYKKDWWFVNTSAFQMYTYDKKFYRYGAFLSIGTGADLLPLMGKKNENLSVGPMVNYGFLAGSGLYWRYISLGGKVSYKNIFLSVSQSWSLPYYYPGIQVSNFTFKVGYSFGIF